MRSPEFWSRTAPTMASRMLDPVGWVWTAATRLRCALARPWRAPARVLCVGNLVAGGAGKTPVALDLARRILARGHAVHFLTRGYGGGAPGPLRVDPSRHGFTEVGDEALLLARVAPTWVGADRAALARAASADGARVLVMDDGFQNPSLVQDLPVVVVDGAAGFGNGRVIPAGPLREPLADGLARARAAVLVGDDERNAIAVMARTRPDLPILGARIAPGVEAARLKGRPALAFAGIGRPEKFFASAAAAGVRVLETASFPDHHPFVRAEVEDIQRRAARLGAVALTTAKDYVRLPAGATAGIEVLTMDLIWDDEAGLEKLLDAFLGPS